MSARIRLPTPRAEWAYFLDVDGTLADFAPSPSLVTIEPNARRLLRSLHNVSGGALALVSGRTIAEVDALVGEPLCAVAGQHGLERRDATGAVTRIAVDRRAHDAARAHVAAWTASYPRLLLEDKGLSLALHYRREPGLAGFARMTMEDALEVAGDGYVLQEGKSVLELKPAIANKGHAIGAFMSEQPFRSRVPVFVGDDATDEDGFAAVNVMGGVSVKVGEGRSIASFRLADIGAVRGWLLRGVGASAGPSLSSARAT